MGQAADRNLVGLELHSPRVGHNLAAAFEAVRNLATASKAGRNLAVAFKADHNLAVASKTSHRLALQRLMANLGQAALLEVGHNPRSSVACQAASSVVDHTRHNLAQAQKLMGILLKQGSIAVYFRIRYTKAIAKLEATAIGQAFAAVDVLIAVRTHFFRGPDSFCSR